MTKDEFRNRLFQEFDIKELGNINPRIYSNPDHVDYYISYHSGEYQKCLDFLRKNRDLLK